MKTTRGAALLVALFGLCLGQAALMRAQPTTKLSRDGAAFIDAVRAARRAIFDGEPETAKTLMRNARRALQTARKDAQTFNIKTTASAQGRTAGTERSMSTPALIPVDAQVVVADDHVLRPDRQAHVDKANEHFKKGEAKQAIEELRLARIDIGFNRVWAPLASSETRLDDAIELADAGKYYEANLVLKSIEDGLTTDALAAGGPSNTN